MTAARVTFKMDFFLRYGYEIRWLGYAGDAYGHKHTCLRSVPEPAFHTLNYNRQMMLKYSRNRKPDYRIVHMPNIPASYMEFFESER